MILFTHSYFLKFDAKQWKQMQPYIPLATLYAAATMRNRGYEVQFFDTMFASSPHDIIAQLEKHKPKYLVIYDDGFNYLTKMCLTNMRDACYTMIACAKKFNCKIIISSSDSTDHYTQYLSKGADVILLGEAEIALAEVINSFEKNETIAAVNGIAFLQNSNIHCTKRKEVINDLDTLAFPAYDLADINEYKKRWMQSVGYFSLNISTTRGCPFKCNWCAKPIYGNRYHAHSAARIADTIAHLIARYDVNHFWITDDIFGLKPGWVNEFATEVEKRNLKFKYKIQSRVDLLLQEENIKALARSGCDEVWVGAESGSQNILNAMDKGTLVTQIYEASALMKKNNMKPCFFLQFGYPGETKKDIELTLKMLFKLMPHDIGISVSYPLPGTKFYETVKSQLLNKTNWTDSDELVMLFKSTFPSAYYKTLQRYVHRKFRALQGKEMIKNIILSKKTSIDIKKIAATPFHFYKSLILKQSLRKFTKHG